jgi:membrane dipeptidase
VAREAAALHRDALVVDLHADTFELVHELGYDLAREHRSPFWADRRLGHVDVPRLRRGGVNAQVFGVVIPPWYGPEQARRKIARQGRLVTDTCQRLGDRLVRAGTAAEILAAQRGGKIAVLVSVEGSHGLADDEAALEEIVAQGVRSVGPAHIFDSAAAPSSYRHREASLSDAGWRFVERLRERSILVDLAHMPRGPFLAICESAPAPVLVSHTGVAGVAPLWRNVDDDQIRAVAATGGVVGVIYARQYLRRPGADGVVDHLEHLIAVGGEDVPALGSDFDGLVKPPWDVADASGHPRVTEALLKRGHTERLIRKILGLNALRVLADVPPPRRGAATPPG